MKNLQKYKDPKTKEERKRYNQELYEELREEAILEQSHAYDSLVNDQ